MNENQIEKGRQIADKMIAGSFPREKCRADITKSVHDLNTLSDFYHLGLSRIIAKPNPMRQRLTLEDPDIDWGIIDKTRIAIHSEQSAFDWLSTHGRLYANKDYHRFKVAPDHKCTFCDADNQTIEHLFLECR